MQTPQRLENQKKDQANGQKSGGAIMLKNNSSKHKQETTDTISIQDVALPSIAEQKRRKLVIKEERKNESDYYNEGALDMNYAQSKQSFTVQKSNIKGRNLVMINDPKINMSQVINDNNNIESQKDRIKSLVESKGNSFKQTRNSAATELTKSNFQKLQMSRDSTSLRRQQRDRLDGIDMMSPMSMPITQRNHYKDRQMAVENGHGPTSFEIHRNSFLPTISIGANKKNQTHVYHQNNLDSNSHYDAGLSKNRFKNKIYNIQDDMDAIQASNMMDMASVTATERFDKSVNYQPGYDYDNEILIRAQKRQSKKGRDSPTKELRTKDFSVNLNSESSMGRKKRLINQNGYNTIDNENSYQRRHETEPRTLNSNMARNHAIPSNNYDSPMKSQIQGIQQSMSSSPVKKRKVYKIALSDIRLKDDQNIIKAQHKINIPQNNLQNDTSSQHVQNKGGQYFHSPSKLRGQNTGVHTPNKEQEWSPSHMQQIHSPDISPNQSRQDASSINQTFSSQVKYVQGQASYKSEHRNQEINIKDMIIEDSQGEDMRSPAGVLNSQQHPLISPEKPIIKIHQTAIIQKTDLSDDSVSDHSIEQNQPISNPTKYINQLEKKVVSSSQSSPDVIPDDSNEPQSQGKIKQYNEPIETNDNSYREPKTAQPQQLKFKPQNFNNIKFSNEEPSKQLFKSEVIANENFQQKDQEAQSATVQPTKRTIYIDFSNSNKPKPQLKKPPNQMPSQKLLIQKKINVKPFRKQTEAQLQIPYKIVEDGEEPSNRSNSRGHNANVVKQNQFDVAANINNQGINMRQQPGAGSSKGHKPQIAKLGSKLAVDQPVKGKGRTLQAAGVGLVGVSGTEKVNQAMEMQQQQIMQGKIQSQQSKLQIEQNKQKLGIPKKSSIALKQDEVQAAVQEEGSLSKRSNSSNKSQRSSELQKAQQSPGKVAKQDKAAAEYQDKQHQIKESIKAMRAKQLPGSNKNVHKAQLRNDMKQALTQMQQPQVKKKKGKKGFDNYVAGDSSEASDGVKYIKMGQEIGNKVKVANSTFCKEYYSNSQFNERAKLNNERKYFTSSERLYISKDFIEKFDSRKDFPILIVNLDGALGYWDLQREMYVIRSKVVESIITLSQDFIIVAVSRMRKAKIRKLVLQFQKIAYSDQQINSYTQSYTHKNITFDAVYHLRSEFVDDCQISTGVNMLENNQNNHVDQVQCDLTQIFVDLQIFNINQQMQAQQVEKKGYSLELEGLTFENYNPLQRVIIFTSKQYSLQSACYSFDFNHYFQIMAPYSKRSVYKHMPKPEECQFSPIILTVPHLRINHKVPFDCVHAVLFATLNLAYQNSKIIIKNQIIKNKLARDTKLRQLHNEKEQRDQEREELELQTGEPQPQSEEDEAYRQYIIQSEQQAFLEEQILEEIDPPQDDVDELDKPINVPHRKMFKKVFCANFSKLNKRVKQYKFQTLRVFDPNLNYAQKFVMQKIDFFYSYKQIKYHLKNLNGEDKMQYDWLKFKAYKLQPKDPELLKSNPELPNSYVSNIDSQFAKDIKNWEEQMKVLDPDNPKYKGPTQPKHYQNNEDAKNLYNSLFSKNRHNLKEITTYKNQYKEAMNKRRKILPRIDAGHKQQQVHKNSNKSSKSVTSDARKKKSTLVVVNDDNIEEDKQSTSNDEIIAGEDEQSPIKGDHQSEQLEQQDKILNVEKQKSIPEDHQGELMLADADEDSEAPKDDSELLKEEAEDTNQNSISNTETKLQEKTEDDRHLTTGQRKVENQSPRSDKDYESSHEDDYNENKQDANIVKRKSYVRKYRTLQIKGQSPADNDPERLFSVAATGELDLKQFVLISLKTEVYEQLCSDTPVDKDDHNMLFSQVHQQKPQRNHLTDLLSAKQRVISYSTTQDSHLQNNLSQLVGGSEQYYEMLHELIAEDDKKQKNKDKDN